jgi:hypothetical protein
MQMIVFYQGKAYGQMLLDFELKNLPSVDEMKKS